MPSPSAGLLLYRRRGGCVEVLLVRRSNAGDAGHAGGWAIPSTELRPGEEPLAAARRALASLGGVRAPSGSPLALGAVKQHQHRIIRVWACEMAPVEALSAAERPAGEAPPAAALRHDLFPLAGARLAIVPGQRRFLDELEYLLSAGDAAPSA